MYSNLMVNDNPRGDYDSCEALVYKLFRKEANAWCNFAHDRDCSFAGIYQPPLPLRSNDFKEFIVSSNFVDVFSFLQLKDTSDLASVRHGARKICTMSLYELEVYNSRLPSSISDVDELVQFCFRATFVASFLIDGIGFPKTANVTAIDVIDGQKLGWALGSTLYEINTLPWEFEGALLKKIDDDLKGSKGSKDSADEERRTVSLVGGRDDAIFASLSRNLGASIPLGIVLVVLLAMLAFRRRRHRFLSSGQHSEDFDESTITTGAKWGIAGDGRRHGSARVTYGSVET